MKYFFSLTVMTALLFVSLKEKPTLYIIGDSTVRNGNRPQAGWGELINEFLDTTQLSISNQAMAGRSTRTFVKEKSSSITEYNKTTASAAFFGYRNASYEWL